MNRIAKPAINNGEWNRIASKTHRHASGIVIRYNHNRWLWEVVGGKDDGHSYTTLAAAQHAATR